jgi:D-psicose/D-tagatose/L-ribulose 3-epimerase
MPENRHGNPIGIHSLVWAGGWSETQARFAIEQTAVAGYDIIEILMMDPHSIDVPMTRRLLDEYGLQASASLGLSLATDVSSDDPEAVAAGRAVLSDAVSIGNDLGLIYLGGVVYGALTKYSAPVSELGRRNSVEAVHEMSEAAAKHGIPIGLELVNRYESNLLNTAKQAMAYIDEVDSDNVYVHLDSYHMNIEEPGMFEPVLTCGDRLGYVHIGEGHRGYLGGGNVDFGGLFRGLEHIGYSGPITFESFSSAVVDTGLSFTLAIWRNLWDDNVDLARHARGFIAAQLGSSASLALQ